LLFSGCNQTKDSFDSKQLTEKFRQALNSHNAAALANLYSENATMIASGESKPTIGKKAIEQSYAIMFRTAPDLKLEYITVISEGNQLCFEFGEKGTVTKPLIATSSHTSGKISPKCHKFEMKGVCLMKVNSDGLIVEDKTYYDTADFQRQIESTKLITQPDIKE
jgi:SnoaL-like polyketide cyclase.